MDAPVASPRSSRPRARRILARIAGVLTVLSMVAAIAVALFGDKIANHYAQHAALTLSKDLGRPVEIGPVSLSLVSGRVQVERVAIGAASDEPKDASLARIERASVDIGMMRTLLSLGLKAYIEQVDVEGVRVTVLKRADGTLNWEHLSKDDEPPPPDDGELDVRVKNARIGELAVRNVEVVFREATQPEPTARISQAVLTAHEVGYRAGGTVDLKAAMLAAAPNLNLHAEIGSLDEAGLIPPVHALRLTLAPTDLAPLAPFVATLADSSSVPTRGTLSADVDVASKDALTGAAKGTITLQEAALPGGKPFDAKLAFAGTTDQKADALALDSADLALGPMKLHASARIERLEASPELRQVALTSEGLSFAAVRALYPSLDEATEPARLDGPFAITAHGGGDTKKQAADLEVALTDTHIVVPDTLDKPAGTPLFLRAHVETGDNALAFSPLRIQLSDFAVVANGRVEDLSGDAPKISMQVETPDPRLRSLLGLLPAVARAGASDKDLGGELRIEGKLDGTSERYQAEGTIALASLAVNVPGLSLAGGGKAQLSLENAGKGSEGKLNVDFTPMTASYGDVFQKRKEDALRVDATLRQKGSAESELTLTSTLSSLTLKGNATMKGEAPRRSFRAAFDVPSCAVRSVARLLPGVDSKSIGDIHFSGRFEAEGIVEQPASVRVSIPRFTAKAGRSDLRGSLSVAGLEAPNIDLKAQSNYFDLAEFLPPSNAPAERATTKPDPAAEREDAGIVARTNGTVDLQVERGRASDVTFEKLRALMRVKDGRARAEKLEVSVFDGRFDGAGSEFPLARGLGEYQLKGDLRKIQVESALAQLANVRDLMRGSLSANVDVRTRELTVDALSATLTGLMQGSMDDGAFLAADGFASFVTQLEGAASLPSVKSAIADARTRVGLVPGQPWSLKDLQGALRFERGSAILERPLTVKTPQGDVKLEGKVGLKSASDLRGTFSLAPAALTALSGGKLSFADPVALPFRVTGSLTQPSFGFDELGRVVAPIVQAYLKEEGAEKLQKGADKALEQAGLKDEADKARDALRRRLEQKRAGQAQR